MCDAMGALEREGPVSASRTRSKLDWYRHDVPPRCRPSEKARRDHPSRPIKVASLRGGVATPL